MPIKKRKLPKKKFKPRPHPRVVKHNRECDDLYNRLQSGDDNDVRYVMDKITGVPCSTYVFIELLSARFDTEISTLQINGPLAKGATFRVMLSWTDRSAKPLYGHIFPRMSCVKTSPRLVHSLILAYIELSKRAGKFL